MTTGSHGDASVIDVSPTPGPDESTALAVRDGITDAIAIVRSPRDVVAKATEAANALMLAISKKKNKVMMGGEQYLEVEDWELIAAFHGCSIKVEADEFVQYGEAEGWEATAVLIARDGREVGRATMMCMNDEPKWSTRTVYEWCQEIRPSAAQYATIREGGKLYARRDDNAPSDALIWEETEQDDPKRPGRKKSKPASARLAVGEERVPSFQLRSMAQTRAASKVCRLNLSYIPMLAGLNTTPAEELPGVERVPQHPPAEQTDAKQTAPATPSTQAATSASESTKASAPSPSRPAPPSSSNADSARVSQADIKAFWDDIQRSGFSVPDVASRIKHKYGLASSQDLTAVQLAELKTWVREGGD